MQNTQESKFFDLHTRGIGYLNRIREVTVRKGQPFMAVTVAALRGTSDDVEYTHIDCVVRGAEAEKLIRRCQAASEAEKKTLRQLHHWGYLPRDLYVPIRCKKG